MLYEPEHHRVVYRDLPLGPLPQGQHQGADQPLELPHRVLNGTAVRMPGETRAQSAPRGARKPPAASRPARARCPF
eukprot:12309982-Alexandrium_andersonii.AAC.1